MPFDGSGNYSLPAAYLAVTAATITATQHNTPLEDIATALTATIKANGSKAFTAEQTLAGNPVTALGAAPKQYVDAQVLQAVALAGLTLKAPVLYCTTANVALTGEQTLDGTLTSASRVLVAFQTAPAENGIYVTGAGAWARASDADTWAEVASAYVPVERGTLWADTLWRTSADTGGTLNTTAINFRRIDGQWLRNAQTGTTYTVSQGDHNKHVTHSNGSAIATTLPQATGNFGNGFFYVSQNLGAGANTITPTTSTINGAATLVQRTGDAHLITSDGTNYRAIPLGLTYEQLSGLTEDTTPDAAADFGLTSDTSGTVLKKVKLGRYGSGAVLSKTATYAATISDVGCLVRFGGLAAEVELQLPSAASCGNGFEISFTCLDSAYGVTVNPNGAETIDTYTTRRTGKSGPITLVCDGSNWFTKSGSWVYISAQTATTINTDGTLTHNLGAAPFRITTHLVCLSTEHGWAAGDKIWDHGSDAGSASTTGIVLGADATSVYWTIGASGWHRILHKTSNTSAIITPANWEFVVTAEAY